MLCGTLNFACVNGNYIFFSINRVVLPIFITENDRYRVHPGRDFVLGARIFCCNRDRCIFLEIVTILFLGSIFSVFTKVKGTDHRRSLIFLHGQISLSNIPGVIGYIDRNYVFSIFIWHNAHRGEFISLHSCLCTGIGAGLLNTIPIYLDVYARQSRIHILRFEREFNIAAIDCGICIFRTAYYAGSNLFRHDGLYRFDHQTAIYDVRIGLVWRNRIFCSVTNLIGSFRGEYFIKSLYLTVNFVDGDHKFALSVRRLNGFEFHSVRVERDGFNARRRTRVCDSNSYSNLIVPESAKQGFYNFVKPVSVCNFKILDCRSCTINAESLGNRPGNFPSFQILDIESVVGLVLGLIKGQTATPALGFLGVRVADGIFFAILYSDRNPVVNTAPTPSTIIEASDGVIKSLSCGKTVYYG